MERRISAKRLLRGSAKLFVNCERCFQSWAKTADTYEVYRKLSRRRKKPDELHQNYIYQMLDTAKQADMETSAVIKYIIDGIYDNAVNKMILYGTRSVRELKGRFISYEAMKKNSRLRTTRPQEEMRRVIHKIGVFYAETGTT